MKKEQKKKLKEWFLSWLLIGGGVFVLFFLVTTTWIGYSVRQKCEFAQGRYGGDCVTALMSYVDDETASLKERNEAVWALGELGDQRALPTLKKYYTGEPCQHDRFLCQYELKKAIKLLESGLNLSAPFWRHKGL